MSNRALVWTLAILAVVVVVVPLLSMLGMMACCGSSMMNMGSNMMGMSGFGIVWMLLAAGIVIALIALAVRGVTRT
jgi:hypothetical protein